MSRSDTNGEHRPLLSTPTETDEPQQQKQEEKWQDLRPHIRPLLTSCFMSIIVGLNDGSIGFMIPQFKKYYNISNQQLSFLFLSNATGYIICAPLNGVFVQRLGQKGTLYVAGGCTLLAHLLIMNGFDFRLTCLLMVFQGSGVALLDAGMNVLTAHLPFATMMLNFVHSIYGLGAMLSPLVGTVLLAHDLSWKYLYAFLSMMSLMNLLVITFALHQSDIGRSDIDIHQGENDADLASTIDTPSPISRTTSAKEIFHQAIMNRTTLLGAFYILIYVGLEVMIGGWGYVYFVESRHGDRIFFAKVLSLYWLALAVGRIVLGYLSGKYGEKSSITLYTLLTLASIVCIWQVEDLLVDAVVFVLIGGFLGPMFPTTISLASKTLPPEMYPTSIGFMAAVGASGTALFPFLTGQIAGHYGMESIPILYLVMAITMLIAWLFMPSAK